MSTTEDFLKILKKLPRKILTSTIKTINIEKNLMNYALEVLKILSGKSKVGIISFSVDLFLNELKDKLNKKEKSPIHFFYANNIEYYYYNNNLLCSGKLGEIKLLNQYDKLFFLKKVIKKYNKKYPLIIGHSMDEIEMLKYLSKKNSLSIGIGPQRKISHFFDIVVHGNNWYPLYNILKRIEST